MNKPKRIQVISTDKESILEPFDSRELILIVFVIVNFEISSFPVDLLFLFEEVLSGLLHWPYKEPSLYSSIARFGDSEISHDNVTEMKFFKDLNHANLLSSE